MDLLKWDANFIRKFSQPFNDKKRCAICFSLLSDDRNASRDINCSGDALHLRSHGFGDDFVYDLIEGNARFNDAISSFKCVVS